MRVPKSRSSLSMDEYASSRPNAERSLAAMRPCQRTTANDHLSAQTPDTVGQTARALELVSRDRATQEDQQLENAHPPCQARGHAREIGASQGPKLAEHTPQQ